MAVTSVSVPSLGVLYTDVLRTFVLQKQKRQIKVGSTHPIPQNPILRTLLRVFWTTFLKTVVFLLE